MTSETGAKAKLRIAFYATLEAFELYLLLVLHSPILKTLAMCSSATLMWLLHTEMHSVKKHTLDFEYLM